MSSLRGLGKRRVRSRPQSATSDEQAQSVSPSIQIIPWHEARRPAHDGGGNKYDRVSPVSPSYVPSPTNRPISPISSTSTGQEHDLKTGLREEAMEAKRRRESAEDARRLQAAKGQERQHGKGAVADPEEPRSTKHADALLRRPKYQRVNPAMSKPIEHRALEWNPSPDHTLPGNAHGNVPLSLSSGLPYLLSKSRHADTPYSGAEISSDGRSDVSRRPKRRAKGTDQESRKTGARERRAKKFEKSRREQRAARDDAGFDRNEVIDAPRRSPGSSFRKVEHKESIENGTKRTKYNVPAPSVPDEPLNFRFADPNILQHPVPQLGNPVGVIESSVYILGMGTEPTERGSHSRLLSSPSYLVDPDGGTPRPISNPSSMGQAGSQSVAAKVNSPSYTKLPVKSNSNAYPGDGQVGQETAGSDGETEDQRTKSPRKMKKGNKRPIAPDTSVPSASSRSHVSRQDEYRHLKNSSKTPGSLEPRVSTTSSPRHKTGFKDALNKDMLNLNGGSRDKPGRPRSGGPLKRRGLSASTDDGEAPVPVEYPANPDDSSEDTSSEVADASKKLNAHLPSGQSRRRGSGSSRISTSRRRHRDDNGNKAMSLTSDDSNQQPGRGQTSVMNHVPDADSKNRKPLPPLSGLDNEDPTGVNFAHSDGSGAKQDLPKATGRSSPPSTSRSPVRKEDLYDSDSSYEIRDNSPASSFERSNSTKPPTTTERLAEDSLRTSEKSSGAPPPPPISIPTGSPAITGLKTWIADLSSQRLGVGIALAVAIVCIFSFGSGGPSGTGLTSLAGGGIFLVALAAIGLWAWYKNSGKGKERERNSVEGSSDSVDGSNKDKDGDGDVDPSDSEDDANDSNGKGDRKGKHSRNQSNGRTDSHDRDRDMSEKCHALHQQAEDRARELFPEVPRHLVLNALDDYAKAPWTRTTTEVRTENNRDRTRTRTKTEDGVRELEKAAKEVWKENPHGKSFSKHFEQLDHQLREEARELFAGLLSCNGAYLSGDLFRVELMFEVPIAIRVTTFPGERLIARPGENKKDGVKQSYHKEQENWYKGLETLNMMKKRWDKLPLPDLPEMPPLEIVCVRPPADFTPNEFERIRRLEVDSSVYRKEKRAFGRACSVQRNAGDFAQGPRREWILDLLLTTRPDCVQVDFLPHRRHQAEILDWNDLSSTSTFRHIGRFVDLIGALSDYTSKHELGMLDVGPCLPLTKDGVRTRASLLGKFAGKFSFKTARVKILRVGLEDPSVLGPDFSEANEVAMTLCDPKVEALDIFQPLSEGAIPSFLVETVNNEQVETFKKTVASQFERRLIDNLYVAKKLLRLMEHSYYALPNQRPCPRIWSPDEWQILDDRVAAVLKEKSGK